MVSGGKSRPGRTVFQKLILQERAKAPDTIRKSSSVLAKSVSTDEAPKLKKYPTLFGCHILYCGNFRCIHVVTFATFLGHETTHGLAESVVLFWDRAPRDLRHYVYVHPCRSARLGVSHLNHLTGPLHPFYFMFVLPRRDRCIHAVRRGGPFILDVVSHERRRG